MALNNITFEKALGGIGRFLPGRDHVSGMIFYLNETDLVIKNTLKPFPVKSVEELVGLDLETGLPEKLEQNPKSTFVIKPQLLFPGEKGYDESESSKIAVVYYHVSEFFRMNPGATLWLSFKTSRNSFVAISDLQTAANGEIRQLAIHDELTTPSDSAALKSTVSSINTKAKELASIFQPVSVIYSNTTSSANPSNYADVTGDANYVSVSIGQSGSGFADRLNKAYKVKEYTVSDLESDSGKVQFTHDSLSNDSIVKVYSLENHKTYSAKVEGSKLVIETADLFSATDKYTLIDKDGQLELDSTKSFKAIGCVGTLLGAVSAAAVHENIGWVQKFNLGGEFAEPMLMNGKAVEELTQTDKNGLNNKRLIFPLKHVGDEGTYFNDSHTAIKPTHDFAYIENNRTIDKAIRNVRTNLLPQLNSPLTVLDGKLSPDTVKFFENLCSQPLERMRNNGELSAFGVAIDPQQPILESSTLNIALQLIPRGVARQIKVTVGFTTKLSK